MISRSPHSGFRMLKAARIYPDEQIMATLSQQLTWSHFIELITIEQSPIGLLLCSEGNSEHVELMMLDEDNIHVAQYLPELPDKQWFIDRLNRSIAIASEHKNNEKE